MATSAGQIEEGKFGLVHRIDLDVDALTREIESYAQSVDPERNGIQVEEIDA